MQRETTEEMVERLQKQADSAAKSHPQMPFWLLCKLIWLAIRRRQVKRIELQPPFTITFET